MPHQPSKGWWLQSFEITLVNLSMYTWTTLFIFSHTLREHEHQLGLVFTRLESAQLYLSCNKVDLYSKSIDCLGHLIDDQGVHADSDKMQCIREWRWPRSYHDIQRFLGLVQYLAHHMPDVTAFTTPLLGCAQNNHPFIWTLLLDKCFESIKSLACRALSREWEPSMGKAKSGRIATQLASCQRSLVMLSITTKHMSTKR